MSRPLTPQQRTAAHTLNAHLCVDAGAGSGKTTVLVARIMHLLENDVPLRRIVAITFTRKAAGEMKERLRDAIHRRADPRSPASMDKWRALELEVDTARVTTIDGFCAALLHENALRVGLDPDFGTLGDEEAPLLRRETAETTFATMLDRNDPAAHRLAVEHGLDRITGFLTSALNQPARMSESAQPYAGLDVAGLVHLWRAQADALQRERYDSLAAVHELREWMAELEELGGKCSDATDRREIVRCDAISSLEDILHGAGDPARARRGIERLLALNFVGGRSTAWTPKEAMQSVKAIVETAQEVVESYAEPEWIPEVESVAAQCTLDLTVVFSEVAAAYRAAKVSRTALDFADLLTQTVRMFHEHADLRVHAAAGIDHLLMDEFQDTNHAQLELARMLTTPGGAKLFVVGDAKQSVYRFRGADVAVFTEARNAVDKTLPLNENFRTVAPLIGFINDFFHDSNLLARVEPKFLPLTASRECAPGPIVEFLIPENDAGEPDDSEDNGEFESGDIAEPRESEAELIAGRIAELCNGTSTRVYDAEAKAWRPACFGDIAILYRAGTHAGVYEEALRKSGVPANVIAGSGYYARQEILDLHNLFNVALDPWDEPALAAFLRGPLAGVSDDTLFLLTRKHKLADAFANGVAVADAQENGVLDRARELIDLIRAQRERPVSALLRDVLAQTGFEAVLLAQHHGVQKAGNVHKLIDLARSFGGAGRQGLRAFTDYLSALARNGMRAGDAELLADSSGAVTLMTVHNAKGLEFPIVVVADMGRKPGGGQTPFCRAIPGRGMAIAVHDARGKRCWPVLGQHLGRIEREDERAEEARVLYVAMTRARDRLLLASGPKPAKHSWMAAVDARWELRSLAHGATVHGAAWSATTVRRTGPTIGQPSTPRHPATVDVSALLHQAAPSTAVLPPDYVMPIQALLDLMHPDPSGEAHRPPERGPELDRQKLGIAAHALLDRWDFNREAPIDAIAKDAFAGTAERAQCAAELTVLIERLKRSSLWPRLAQSEHLCRELPFQFAIDGVWLSGTIDAWLDGDTIVDYKLSVPQPWKRARYETQLRLYAAAVRAATGRIPGRAELYYLRSGESVDVDVSERALNATLDRARAALRAGFAA